MRRAPATPRASGTGWPHSFDLDALELGGVAVLHVDQPAGNAAAEDALGGLRHGGGGLAGPDYEYALETGGVEALQAARDGVRGIGRGQRGLEDGDGVFPEKTGDAGMDIDMLFHLSRGCARMVSTAAAGSSPSMAMWMSARR